MRRHRWNRGTLNLLSLVIAVSAMNLVPATVWADDAPVRVKQVPALAEPTARLPRNLNYDAVRRKWGLEAWWAVTTTRENLYEKTRAGSGMFVALMSPELIAAVTDREARRSRMSGEEAQQLYSLNLQKYYGDGPSGCERIVFAGYIQIDQFAYSSVDVIDSDWTFTLSTEDGKAFPPSHVTLSPFDYHDLNEEGTTLQRKAITVTFDNLDPATRKPILTPETSALTLELSGRYGAVKARFVFGRRRKR